MALNSGDDVVRNGGSDCRKKDWASYIVDEGSSNVSGRARGVYNISRAVVLRLCMGNGMRLDDGSFQCLLSTLGLSTVFDMVSENHRPRMATWTSSQGCENLTFQLVARFGSSRLV